MGEKTFLTVLLDLMLVNFITKVNLQIVYDLAGKLLKKKKNFFYLTELLYTYIYLQKLLKLYRKRRFKI